MLIWWCLDDVWSFCHGILHLVIDSLDSIMLNSVQFSEFAENALPHIFPWATPLLPHQNIHRRHKFKVSKNEKKIQTLNVERHRHIYMYANMLKQESSRMCSWVLKEKHAPLCMFTSKHRIKKVSFSFFEWKLLHAWNAST